MAVNRASGWGQIRKILEPMRIETTGASATHYLESMSGYAEYGVVSYWVKVHKVKTTATTQVGLLLATTPDADTSTTKQLTAPISTAAIASEPTLLSGQTDIDTDGPFGDWMHPAIQVAGGAGEWAVVEVWEIRKIFF